MVQKTVVKCAVFLDLCFSLTNVWNGPEDAKVTKHSKISEKAILEQPSICLWCRATTDQTYNLNIKTIQHKHTWNDKVRGFILRTTCTQMDCSTTGFGNNTVMSMLRLLLTNTTLLLCKLFEDFWLRAHSWGTSNDPDLANAFSHECPPSLLELTSWHEISAVTHSNMLNSPITQYHRKYTRNFWVTDTSLLRTNC